MNLNFQPAQLQDADVIFEQARELIERYEDPDLVEIPKVLSWMEKKIHSEISGYTRVLHNGEIVGYFHLDKSQTPAELDDFYVLPAHRGQGIGAKILETLLKDMEMPVFLYVFKENYPAIRLYERMGFVPSRDVSKTRCILMRNG